MHFLSVLFTSNRLISVNFDENLVEKKNIHHVNHYGHNSTENRLVSVRWMSSHRLINRINMRKMSFSIIWYQPWMNNAHSPFELHKTKWIHRFHIWSSNIIIDKVVNKSICLTKTSAYMVEINGRYQWIQ